MKTRKNQVSNPNPEPSIEALRAESERLERLHDQIAALEAEKLRLLGSAHELSSSLEQLHRRMGEWEWFFEHSLEMMCIAGTDGFFKRVNPAFANTLGYSIDELVQQPFLDFVHPDDRDRTIEVYTGLGGDEDCINFQNRYRDREGNWRWISWHCPAMGASAKHIYAIARDITDHKRAESELLYRARHDSLTGLLNRAAFEDGLGEAVLRAARNPAHELALYLVDLDGFKNINDTHGHPAGDKLLREVGARLRRTARDGEMVCRLGGDEFALLIEGNAGLPLEPLAKRIDKAICVADDPQESSSGIGCCIGISVLPRHAGDADSLMAQADAALYSLKRDGKGGFRAFEASGEMVATG